MGWETSVCLLPGIAETVALAHQVLKGDASSRFLEEIPRRAAALLAETGSLRMLTARISSLL